MDKEIIYKHIYTHRVGVHGDGVGFKLAITQKKEATLDSLKKKRQKPKKG